MTKSTAYETWIELGYNGSENSPEFNEWYKKMEALNEARMDTMLELIVNGLRNAIKTGPIEDRIDC